MNWAPPIRQQFRVTTGALGENNMRSIVLHFESGTSNVDGFACSACDWFYVFTTSEADGTLPRREVDTAHARFAEHVCAEYPKVRLWDDAP
jgi:hypothetical protein